MVTGQGYLVLCLTLLGCTCVPRAVCLNITLGYLTAVSMMSNENYRSLEGLSISGAIMVAVEDINNNSTFLPGIQLNVVWNDTKGETTTGTRILTEMLFQDTEAFFGPEKSCSVEATVAAAWDRPMISYNCADYKVSNKKKFPTFIRLNPPATQVTKSVISLFKYYSWSKFSIIVETAEDYMGVADSLAQEALKNNMTINHRETFENNFQCCARQDTDSSCCDSSYWYTIIQKTKTHTRLYVFIGNNNDLINMMKSMQMLQLFEKGEYMVIYIDILEHYTEFEARKYLWVSEEMSSKSQCDEAEGPGLQMARSLLVVVGSPPDGENFRSFSQKVRDRNEKEPFNFAPSTFLSKSVKRHVSIYAAHLYDSVQLYAHALDKLIKDEIKRGSNMTNNRKREIARSGKNITDTIIEMGKYQSITGSDMKIDKNGDSEGNYTVVAFKPYNYTYVGKVTKKLHFQCPYYMVQVGHFYQNEDRENGLPDYRCKEIDWPGGEKPLDEPTCGYDGNKCPTHLDKMNKSIIAAVILGCLLFIALIVIFCIYREWKITQEIEGLLWKIEPQEIQGHELYTSPSKVSLMSIQSFESRTGRTGEYADTAIYKESIVRIKCLKFSKKPDISHAVKKEMRCLREIRHGNITPFIGACPEPLQISLITEYCSRGSLEDVLSNENIKLEFKFIVSFTSDLINAMEFLHSSELVCHGNLNSSNCVITSRFVLQVTDFGLRELHHTAEPESGTNNKQDFKLQWKAPELLRDPRQLLQGTQKGDVYAFGIILYELFGRSGPFGDTSILADTYMNPRDIVEKVKAGPTDKVPPFRPDIEQLKEGMIECPESVIACMKECWSEDPENRPDIPNIKKRLKRLKKGMKGNIIDQMMAMMEMYANNLEILVKERTRQLDEEKQKMENLLHRMLPSSVADKLARGEGFEPQSYDSCTVYFSDIVGFTAMSSESTPLQVVGFLNDLYTLFDRIIQRYDVYKVETIGDAYMVVSGVPNKNGNNHAGMIASMALQLLAAVKQHKISHRPNDTVKLRIGIHSGPLVVGVVGLSMPRYCLFGDTVNTASRLESTGEPLKIHISSECRRILDLLGGYEIVERGLVPMKGKGDVRTHWLLSANEKAIKPTTGALPELQPLFCRPAQNPTINDLRRRSPRLNSDSRQGSLGGYSSRRQSVLRPVDCEVATHSGTPTSKCPSPRSMSEERVVNNSQETIAGSENHLHVPVSYCDRDTDICAMQESKSLDAFPSDSTMETLNVPHQILRDSKSLENISDHNKPMIREAKSVDGKSVVLNGGLRLRMTTDDTAEPLLPFDDNKIKIQESREPQRNRSENREKRWYSYEEITEAKPSRKSVKKWLLQFFNNGFWTSDSSGRKGLQSGLDVSYEKESAV